MTWKYSRYNNNFLSVFLKNNSILQVFATVPAIYTTVLYRDYFMVGECERFLFTSCERSLNERVSAANE